MHRFQVWAPRAAEVGLVVEGRATEAMVPSAGGWWTLDVAAAGPGTRYGFSLDGGPTHPDPRAPSQPDGVEGRSEVVDHDAYRWTDATWRGRSLAGSVLYELHVGTFSAAGTFAAAIEHLPHLVDLGVDVVELMPVVEFPGRRGWGYDGVDLFAPHHAYGGPDGLKALIDACHGHGLAVVIDVVYNHLGPAGNHLPAFGPYFSARHHTIWGDAVNFDGPDAHEVRRFVIDNALMWLRDYHADGLRLDAVHAIVDESAPHILEALATEVDALATHVGRPLSLIAESDLNEPRLVRGREDGGYGLDAAWADDWHHALHAVLTGERDGYYEDFGTLEMLAKALRQAWAYDGGWSTHRGCHHGGSPAGLAGHRFVIYAQNHDQVGNRAAGERLATVVGGARARIAAALLLTSPFTPMLFQGEEWGASAPFQYFTEHDAELGRAVSEGRRHEFAPFGWEPGSVPDPQDEATFLRSKLDWAERDDGAHRELLEWYRALLALRRARPELSDPDPRSIAVDVDVEAASLVVRRGRMRVLVNLGSTPRSFPDERARSLLAGSDPEVTLHHGATVVPADAVAIVEISAS
jgi:maltooligosyltrehalose trehalohydrolase